MTQLSRRPGLLLAIAALILMLALGLFSFWGSRRLTVERPVTKETLPILGTVGNFELLRQDGAKITAGQLQGKIWVADFIFTRCAGPCPLITARMRALAEKLRDNDRLRFISFSVDPDFDTPEVLSKYAAPYHADPERWYFLTGDKDKIYELSERNFHLGIGDVPVEEREALDQAIRHSARLTLVDAFGRIRGYYDSETQSSLDQLMADIGRL